MSCSADLESPQGHRAPQCLLHVVRERFRPDPKQRLARQDMVPDPRNHGDPKVFFLRAGTDLLKIHVHDVAGLLRPDQLTSGAVAEGAGHFLGCLLRAPAFDHGEETTSDSVRQRVDLNRIRDVVDEVDQQSDVGDREEHRKVDGDVRHEGRGEVVRGRANGPQHQQRVNERGDQHAQDHLVDAVRHEVPHQPGAVGGTRGGHHRNGDRERGRGNPQHGTADGREHRAGPVDSHGIDPVDPDAVRIRGDHSVQAHHELRQKNCTEHTGCGDEPQLIDQSAPESGFLVHGNSLVRRIPRSEELLICVPCGAATANRRGRGGGISLARAGRASGGSDRATSPAAPP